jgi:hypothetical protein
MAGKETLVLRGLEATRKSIDEFLAFFPQSDIDKQKAIVKQENELNIKEFDAELGAIFNMPNP